MAKTPKQVEFVRTEAAGRALSAYLNSIVEIVREMGLEMHQAQLEGCGRDAIERISAQAIVRLEDALQRCQAAMALDTVELERDFPAYVLTKKAE